MGKYPKYLGIHISEQMFERISKYGNKNKVVRLALKRLFQELDSRKVNQNE